MKLYKKNFYFNASKKDSSNLKIFIISGEKEDIIKEINNLISLKEII